MYGFGPRSSFFDDIHRLQREINRLFAGTVDSLRTPRFPAVNLRQNNEAVILEAEVPGVDPAQINVTVQRDTVTISGSRPAPQTAEDDVIHRQERFSGEFTRTFELPCRVDENAVKATYKNGVLTVTMPRAPEDKPKQIKVITA
ncbi:MAG: Hsp20/alpha crystallin family protein [bacterium]|nr:Hsp20/alpha crystallin family protein [bacterium]